MPVTDGKYVTGDEIRNEGVTVQMASDTKITIAIADSERFIERVCNRWFYKSSSMTLKFSGGRHYNEFGLFLGKTTDELTIPIPIITLTGVTIDGTARDINDFIVFNRIGPPEDDRDNPRIVDKNIGIPEYGLLNIELTGTFGYVEDAVTGTTPGLIKIAARKLAILMLGLKPMTDPEYQAVLDPGTIIEEEIPGYRYRKSEKFIPTQDQSITGDSEIDAIIDMYAYRGYVTAA